jgi:hypothetical protein
VSDEPAAKTDCQAIMALTGLFSLKEFVSMGVFAATRTLF